MTENLFKLPPLDLDDQDPQLAECRHVLNQPDLGEYRLCPRQFRKFVRSQPFGDSVKLHNLFV